MNLKEAYEKFVAAIKEETGLKPHIDIYIHTHAYGNEFGNSKDMAINTSYGVSRNLGLKDPIEGSSENSKWLKASDDDDWTEFIYFYEEEDKPDD